MSEYDKLREEYYGSHSFDFSEFVLPMYTEGLAEKGETEAAIAITKLNVDFFPESYYTVAVLGGLYESNGQNELAIESYERAIELSADVSDAPHMNELARQYEFSLRDPDGYALTIARIV